MPSKISTSKRDEEPPTVLQAVNKLKAEQERIIQEHKRFHVIRRRLERQQAAERNRVRQEQFWQSVRESAAREEEEECRQVEQQKLQETKVRHSNNLHAKEVQQRALEKVKRLYRQSNHELYERIRQRQLHNEQIISTQRTQLKKSRMASRLQVHQAEDQRRRTIQNFYEARSKQRSDQKNKQLQQILRQSQQKHRMYAALLTRNSRIRQTTRNSSVRSSLPSARQPIKQTI